MRALGPGSVSSFLKIILDVVYVAFWVAAIAGVVGTLALYVFDFDPKLLGKAIKLNLDPNETPATLTMVATAFTAYVIAVLIIVERLRKIFATLTAGDPFHPDNVGRLRWIGVMLIALELGRYPLAVAKVLLMPDMDGVSFSPNPTAWFAVLVVFVLAEVFREGARLRREAELTI
ncbi:DUF2975 domain-containing protein [Phenylobacterium montanum]|uniref:DUF2975 domain-containing protein n=1 Tax=Phenylobacterium montanum TaxID=2823693 RepID=A0A975FWK4_9CAUL|nr:DUF2975 domain-containing protein [Caulobacter sp. S6]QUD86466.1 DUF2975 domain-containing protein [Caulobacter sp. S6]